MNPANTRQDAFYLLLLGTLVFVLAGSAIEILNYSGMVDFREYYFGSRLLLEHHDPYKQSELSSIYQREGHNLPSAPCPGCWSRSTDHMTPNFPTTFFLVAPLATLPWTAAKIIWMILTAACFILASFLMMSAGVEFAPVLSAGLVFLFLVNSVMLLAFGNAVGIVVGLTVIAAWCFLQNRWAIAGAVCLALALVIKPHDAGLVCLYFLLADRALRRRALQSLAMAAALAAAATLWTSRVAPHWLQELLSNQSAIMARGGINDPGPASTGNFGLNLIINLQTIVSRFWDHPHFYNAVAFLICGPLLLVWLLKTMRSAFTPQRAWFALAAVAPLSMLFLYHRSYDARLLLLAVPACAILWKEGGALARCMLTLLLAAIVFTGDVFWIVLLHIVRYQGFWVRYAFLPAPIILLMLSAFSLWVYWRRVPGPRDFAAHQTETVQAPAL